jgi:hypothetical protein
MDDDDEFLYGNSKPLQLQQQYVQYFRKKIPPPINHILFRTLLTNTTTSNGSNDTQKDKDGDPEDTVDIGEEDVTESQPDGEESDEVGGAARATFYVRFC